MIHLGYAADDEKKACNSANRAILLLRLNEERSEPNKVRTGVNFSTATALINYGNAHTPRQQAGRRPTWK
jgi:hypothetical protein